MPELEYCNHAHGNMVGLSPRPQTHTHPELQGDPEGRGRQEDKEPCGLAGVQWGEPESHHALLTMDKGYQLSQAGRRPI